MKDYSDLIPTSYGFVTKYEIIGNEIHIYTPETKRGEPHKYPLNEEWLSKIEKRLENQYQLIIENRQIVKKFKIKKLIAKIAPPMNIGGVLFVITAIICAINNILLWFPLFLTALLLILVQRPIIKKYAKQVDNELNLIEAYLQNKDNIEELTQNDPNITKYLSKNTKKQLIENQNLKEKGSITSVFNVDFMDKTNDKDLRKILDRYTISKSLLEPQTFVKPLEKQNYKTKKRKKEEN